MDKYLYNGGQHHNLFQALHTIQRILQGENERFVIVCPTQNHINNQFQLFHNLLSMTKLLEGSRQNINGIQETGLSLINGTVIDFILPQSLTETSRVFIDETTCDHEEEDDNG